VSRAEICVARVAHPHLLDIRVIVRLLCGWFSASITLHITHYVARRVKVISDHPHNA
jgi:hypothetical protein